MSKEKQTLYEVEKMMAWQKINKSLEKLRKSETLNVVILEKIKRGYGR